MTITTPSGRSSVGSVTKTAGTATGTAKGAVTTVADKVAKPLLSGDGAAFALLVRKAMLFLRFLRQLALRLLEALNQLALRLQEFAARRRGGEQKAVDEEAEEEAGEDDRREPETRPAPPRRPEGLRPQRPVRPRPDAATPDAPGPAVRRRASMARRPERPSRRVPGAGGAR
jgi:hypothetical protein